MRPNHADIALFLFLFALSFLPLTVTLHHSALTYAEIYSSGTLVRRVPLSTHTGREELPLVTPLGENLIVIEEQSISIEKADCPDHICVNEGRISKAGEVIACLPHKILIAIKGEGDDGVIPLR